MALLAGTQLYRTRFAAVRELLQNAFDAIREQIAIELLQDPDPLSPVLQLARAQLHRVSFVIEQRGSEHWIVCSDTGSGMTRRVIEKHLLVSGSQPRPELLELQRDCATKGIPFERSGEFGIGVLSYFMIAEKMIVETKSGGDFGSDNEVNGWRFEIDGLDAVGELRPVQKLHRGTTIQLRIKDEFKETLLSSELALFFSDLIAKSPCNVEIKAHQYLRLSGPGWIVNLDDWKADILRSSFSRVISDRFLSSEEARIESEKRWNPIKTVAGSRLRLLSSEGKLPFGVGTYRIALPYFELERGLSLGFLCENAETLSPLPTGHFCALAPRRVRFSWRGFIVDSESESARSERTRGESIAAVPAIVEADFADGASISVNRENLLLENRDELLTFLARQVGSLLDEFLKLQGDSPYAAITLAVARTSENVSAEKRFEALGWWIFPLKDNNTDESKLAWRKIRFPAIEQEEDQEELSELVLARNGLADQLVPLTTNGRVYNPLPAVMPQRLVLLDRPTLEFAAIYEADCIRQRHESFWSTWPVHFPEEWRDVAIIETSNRYWLNSEHRLVGMATSEACDAVAEISRKARNDIDSVLAEAVSDPELAAAWFLFNHNEDVDFWRNLNRSKKDRLAKLFEITCLPKWIIWCVDTFGPGLMVADAETIEYVPGVLRPGAHWAIPIPADEKWIVKEKRRQTAARKK